MRDKPATLHDSGVGILDTFRPSTPPPGLPPAQLAAEPVATPGDPTSGTGGLADLTRARHVAMDIALSIGAVRKAQHVIAGTIGTWPLAAWDGDDRLAVNDPRVSWLEQPEPRKPLQWLITHTVKDLIWHDRSVWRITDRTLYGRPTTMQRVHPDRIGTIADPHDPDRVDQWLIDGAMVRESELVIFDGAGIGGLQRFGYELLTIYGKLQAAAGRYAEAPHPHAILKNHGADLTTKEIDALLQSWESARATRSVGYLNEVVDYETVGWNAQELQLTEAREAAALDVARLFGLPAIAVDASTGGAGGSLTYANLVDRRRDLVQALEPWSGCIESGLSLQDRAGTPRGIVVPRGLAVRFDTTDYTRPDPNDRAATWAALIDAGLLTAEEARTLEPLTRRLT